MAVRLTDRGIAALKAADKPYLIFDSEVSGLAIKVYETGRKAFVFDWREHGRQRRVTIGKHPAWTTAKARIHASKLRLKADVGEIVAVQRGERVVDLIERWRAVVAVTRQASTARNYDQMIRRHIVPAFGRDDPRALTRNRVEAWHGNVAQTVPMAANRALAVLSAFLSWLERDHKIERNPCKGVKRRPEHQRQIFLDEAEIARAHAALDADPNRSAALALRLALATGCRIGEAVSLDASQIDVGRQLWIKPHHLTKQKRTHILPLQPEALDIALELIRIGLPDYQSCRRCWDRVREVIGREDARVHDLRHSRASSLARNGASLPMIGRVLGHSSPGTTARYAHLVDRDLVDLVERSK